MKGQSTATLRSLRISPRKVRLMIDLIRGMRVHAALAQLMVNTKHTSRPIAKLLQSAIANATNNHHLDENTLKIVKATVDGGAILYRQMPKAFGNVTRIRKRSSHITIVLEGEVKKGATSKKENTDGTTAPVEAEIVTTKKPRATKAKKA
jgi:large subunit ribosomal protein L22